MGYYKECRTTKILKRFHGLPGEFYMLKGLLCVSSVFEPESFERVSLRELYDSQMIANRMDKVNKEDVLL